MRLARANTAVPVPEVLGVVHEADKTYLYIEYIDGKTLDEAWGTLSSTDIARIKSSFATYFEGVLADGHVCLVHADLHAENMLVKNSRIVAILDWVMASWLPRAVQSYVMVNYLQADRLGPGSVFNALGDVQPRP
ncbi:hypothetical protein Rt10032_c22g6552 [Rhodotorula toruloides]|uniref:Protein kinase domain-containing protein n=1 Tax=Rhodotorula toruloides TaxID=5286 RepID=A0A511KRJ1_RHOTO|nr:hypothetical protein Rt10032_c22g6552 [Rhodotorula toruloides]